MDKKIECCRYRSNVFLFFTRQNMRARKVGRVSEVLRVRAQSGTQFVQACKERNLKWFKQHCLGNKKQKEPPLETIVFAYC